MLAFLVQYYLRCAPRAIYVLGPRLFSYPFPSFLHIILAAIRKGLRIHSVTFFDEVIFSRRLNTGSSYMQPVRRLFLHMVVREALRPAPFRVLWVSRNHGVSIFLMCDKIVISEKLQGLWFHYAMKCNA